jgi:hypothetical protein
MAGTAHLTGAVGAAAAVIADIRVAVVEDSAAADDLADEEDEGELFYSIHEDSRGNVWRRGF